MSTRDWLRLACTPGIGPLLGMRLLERYATPAAALAAGDRAWRELGVPAKARAGLAAPDAARIAAAQRWLEPSGHHLITHGDRRYPAALADIAAAPPWLYAIGDTDLLAHPAIAIVGSRNPSAAGAEAARTFAAALARAGLVVVSGLARGIDAAAHAGALAAEGMTAAVCATGLDRIYPAANKALAEDLAARGLLLSEFALGTPPARGNFPRRNRIIAGLCTATLVVEAAHGSGSLITARLANQAGRAVFALPGSIHNPLARGCHQLIRDGAKLVETTDHILEDIAPALDGFRRPTGATAGAATGAAADPAESDDDHAALIAALGHEPARVDDLVERTGWTAEAVSSTLLILELQGRVAMTAGGRFIRAG